MKCAKCGAELQAGQTFCTACGAPTAAVPGSSPTQQAPGIVPDQAQAASKPPVSSGSNSRYLEPTNFASYDQTPRLRRIGIVILLTLVFTPTLLIVAATGPVYVKRHGQVMMYTKRSRINFMIVSGILTLSAMIRAFLR